MWASNYWKSLSGILIVSRYHRSCCNKFLIKKKINSQENMNRWKYRNNNNNNNNYNKMMMMIMTGSISIISSKHIGLRIEKKKRKIWTNFHLSRVACEQFLCCDRWERTEGRDKRLPTHSFRLFFLGLFRSGAGYFFRPAILQLRPCSCFSSATGDVFQSVLTSTCEKQEGMEKKNSSPCKVAKQKRGSVAL